MGRRRDRIYSQKGDGREPVSDSGFKIIDTTATERVGEVRLYDETWEHIVAQHPEFSSRIPSLEHAIIDTLKNPTMVCSSTTQPETSVVFARLVSS